MSYLSNFERSFSEHTLAVIEEYSGTYDATLLINCLLGLLVVPKETVLNAIPDTPLSELKKWGIEPASIRDPGRSRGTKDPDPKTLRGLVANLRHSVAHFRIQPVPKEGEVNAFEFRNDRGLNAVISLSELREFVKKLSAHLKTQ
ncbi:HEPN family nuclease [Caenimonas sp. SL110]|uniref:HEPN family nuclease n=1 Tax=Caenimonas sp. SL110 TaxID=1450524 RepID=UPI000654374B|nr:HEPN family nuclease [Caenimonas sp. SL110]